MAVLKFNNVGITAISACVPKKVSSNYDLLMENKALEKLIGSIGIKEKRIAEDDVTSSDLCYKAAKQLMTDNNTDPESIDMLLFLTTTPDYIQPPTSSILQHKLGLPTSTACLDLSLACSGFVYALSTAYAYASISGINKVLVLVGETVSKIVNKKDYVNFPLYGDAGTACIVEKGDFKKSVFVLGADGSGEDSLKIPYGGFRFPLKADNLVDKIRENGNVRRDVDIVMDGMDTFSFAVRNLPQQLTLLMKEAEITPIDVDYLIFHQGNRMMMEFIMKRLKFDPNKVPFSIEKYGNTSSASVPLTIVSELAHKLEGEKRMLLSTVGAGWSFGSAYISTNDIRVSQISEY
ncbi:3-oxoacyl-ACP synthase III family protein [Mariniphaga sp.]|uniref:3-oxoacyl-ACP synthase III family protein n=1 Tax=Mariniphaga sp. TaxID=1954475 RepID=UPI00356A1E01